MSTYVLTELAEQDVENIWRYIAQDSRPAADKVVAKLQSAMSALATMPLMGHRRSELQDPSLRVWSVYSYLIVYDPRPEPLLVLRVIHGARDLPTLDL